MAIRLIIPLTAAPGKGAEVLRILRDRCAEVLTEPGCEQFEVFGGGLDPDRLTLLELWTDQAALDAHAAVNAARAPLPAGLFAGPSAREDYLYNRTR